jgi:hypothetical protein
MRHERRCGDRNDDERRRGAKQRATHAPGVEENQNAKRCRNWILTHGAEMAAKRETTMTAEEGPSSCGVNPMPERRVLDCILSVSDEGTSSGKEERTGEGAPKWVRGLPHVCEHKCLATMKRGRGSSEEGVEDLISDSGNNHDDNEASFSESHYLFTCFIAGAQASLSWSFIKLISAYDDVFHACHDLIPSFEENQF